MSSVKDRGVVGAKFRSFIDQHNITSPKHPYLNKSNMPVSSVIRGPAQHIDHITLTNAKLRLPAGAKSMMTSQGKATSLNSKLD